jgi:hypothetical protein
MAIICQKERVDDTGFRIHAIQYRFTRCVDWVTSTYTPYLIPITMRLSRIAEHKVRLRARTKLA